MTTRTVASELASRLVAMENCRKSGNTEWLQRHERVARAIVKEFLPDGSGFDNGTALDFHHGDASRLVFRTSFHHMDDNGTYNGWTEHIVTCRATFNGLELKISGRDRNGIRELISQSFHCALSAEVSDDFILKAGA